MSKKCRAYSESKLGLSRPDNRKAFYAGWDAALRAALAEHTSQRKPLTDDEICAVLGFGEYTTASTKTTLIHTARAIERAHDIGEKE